MNVYEQVILREGKIGYQAGKIKVNFILFLTLNYEGKKRVMTTGMAHFWTSIVGFTTSFDSGILAS